METLQLWRRWCEEGTGIVEKTRPPYDCALSHPFLAGEKTPSTLMVAAFPAPFLQAWAEEPFVMGAYGAWWPPHVLTQSREQWAAVPGGRIFFAGTEWSDVGAGYMNGAIHNGRKHGSMVWKLLQQELSSEGSV